MPAETRQRVFSEGAWTGEKLAGLWEKRRTVSDGLEAYINRLLARGAEMETNAPNSEPATPMALVENEAGRATAASSTSWLERREMLERQLVAIDSSLRVAPNDLQSLYERASTLEGLGRYEAAQAAYFALLAQNQSHIRALLRLGALLFTNGSTHAAMVVLSEAATRFPNIASVHVAIARVHLSNGVIDLAANSYRKALQLDANSSGAHQGLAIILESEGKSADAQLHWRAGISARLLAPGQYRGRSEPIRVLMLTSAAGGNIPIIHHLDTEIFQTTSLIVESYAMMASLPPHDLVLNAIGEADRCGRALAIAEDIISQTTRPVINKPSRVLLTGRVDNAAALGDIPGVRTPLVVGFQRSQVTLGNVSEFLSSRGLTYPFLIRSPGFHTGQHFNLIENENQLRDSMNSLPGEALLAISYLETIIQEGYRCKYRVMMIDGRLYPAHAAFSRDWKVHYFSGDTLSNADQREREGLFLHDISLALGLRAVSSLKSIVHALELDYAGIDFGLDEDGNICVFEANATMVIRPPNPKDSRHDYRRPAIGRIVDAVGSMIAGRSGHRVPGG